MQNSTLQIDQTIQFSSKNVIFNGLGVLGTALAGTSSNIDLLITDDCFLSGGILRVSNATFGDYVCLQCVDIDGIVSPAGTVLSQFISNFYMRSDNQQQFDIQVSYCAKIPSGLYLRVVYTSIGTSNVSVSMNYSLHNALY